MGVDTVYDHHHHHRQLNLVVGPWDAVEDLVHTHLCQLRLCCVTENNLGHTGERVSHLQAVKISFLHQNFCVITASRTFHDPASDIFFVEQIQVKAHLCPLHILINLADRHQKIPTEAETNTKWLALFLSYNLSNYIKLEV